MSTNKPWEEFQVIELPEVNKDEPWKNFQPMPKDNKVPKQKIRANLQGWTLGFADELEALVRSSVSSKSYDEIRDEIRGKLNAYREAHPGEALSMELLGAIVPTVAAYLTPWPGDEVVATTNVMGALARGGKVGAVEGAVAGYATGEQGIIQDLQRVPGGAVIGAGFSGILTLAGKPVGYITNSLMTKARQMFGDAGAGDVAAKIRQLAESTGKSQDEVILAISRGEILADDPAIRDALTALNNEITVTTPVDDVLIDRANKASQDASTELQKGLTPGVTGNVFADYRIKDKNKTDEVKDMYTNAYANTDELTKEIKDSMKSAIQSETSLTATLDEIYRLKKMKPLVRIVKKGKKKGQVIFNREPTLEDAEIIRRTIDEMVDEAFDNKKYTKGGLLKDFEENLRGHLDDFSDDLRLAREESAIQFKKRDGFDLGRKALGKDTDELFALIQDMTSGELERGNTAAMEGLRAGLMVAIRNKIRKSPTFFNRASEEGSQFNEVIRQLFPGEKVDDVIERVRLASVTKNTKGKVLGGSPTSGREQAKVDMGIVASAATGNPSAIASLGLKIVADMDPQLTAKQKNKVVELILSEDPELITKVLKDNSYAKQIQSYINRVGTGMLKGSIQGTSLVGANVAGDESEKIINNMLSQ